MCAWESDSEGDRYACEFKLHMRMLLLPAAANNNIQN